MGKNLLSAKIFESERSIHLEIKRSSNSLGVTGAVDLTAIQPLLEGMVNYYRPLFSCDPIIPYKFLGRT